MLPKKLYWFLRDGSLKTTLPDLPGL
jgi:hypothetical protein